MRHHARGAAVYVLTLGLTTLALASLHRFDPSPARAVELAVLVVAGAAATITRYVALRTWVFARARAARHGGRGGVVLRPPHGGTTAGQGGARGGRHAGRGPWHRRRPGRGGRDGLRDRAQHARRALGGRPPRDDRGDRRARDRRRWHRHRGRGRPSRSDEVRALVARIAAEQGRLDVLVNDVWGAEHLFEWDTPVWEHDLDERTAARAPGHRHAPHHQPPRAAAADGAPRRPADRGDRRDRRLQRRALPQLALLRPRQERGDPPGVGTGTRARSPTARPPSR